MVLRRQGNEWRAAGIYAMMFDSGTDSGLIRECKNGIESAPQDFRKKVHCPV